MGQVVRTSIQNGCYLLGFSAKMTITLILNRENYHQWNTENIRT